MSSTIAGIPADLKPEAAVSSSTTAASVLLDGRRGHAQRVHGVANQRVPLLVIDDFGMRKPPVEDWGKLLADVQQSVRCLIDCCITATSSSALQEAGAPKRRLEAARWAVIGLHHSAAFWSTLYGLQRAYSPVVTGPCRSGRFVADRGEPTLLSRQSNNAHAGRTSRSA